MAETEEDKLFYSIGEVAEKVGVKPYVLRYWESEFDRLNPKKTPTGQRAYRKRDLETARTIKKLLYEEKYTIAGARKKLEELEREGLGQLDMFGRPPAPPAASVPNGSRADEIRRARDLLRETLQILEPYHLVRDGGPPPGPR